VKLAFETGSISIERTAYTDKRETKCNTIPVLNDIATFVAIFIARSKFLYELVPRAEARQGPSSTLNEEAREGTNLSQSIQLVKKSSSHHVP
jgi:hypothetical protein